MCGIVGILGRANACLLNAMSDLIAHRGPDGYGLWIDETVPVGLAHRRLSIIDLSAAAAQPMSGVNSRYQVVFNGEIYNFKSLAAELTARGYEFNEQSDTAILAPLFDCYGPAMLTRLNGIFAFAIWDRLERSLFVARDHVGAKPLYYTNQPGRFAFASELKALMALPDLDKTIDESAVLDYVQKLWSPGEKTPFRSIRKLPPGHWMRVTQSGASMHAWTSHVGDRQIAPTSESTAKTALLKVLDQVVSEQCVSDVPVGAFLSGGVDSSAIVASMVKTGHRPAQSYCIGFEGDAALKEGFGNDLYFAKIAADSLGVSLKTMYMKAPKADEFEKLAYILDEPQADPAPLYVAAISEAARSDGVKVLLGGTGGDDIFSGYRRHVAASLRTRLGPLRLAFGIAPDIPRSGPTGRRLSRLIDMMRGDCENFLERSASFNDPALARACLSDEALNAADSQPNTHWINAIADRRHRPLVERAIRLERFGFLPDHNLNYTDKASMAHGVEVRVPFLDPRMIAFADSLPLNYKVRGLEAKWLLKQAVESRVPKAITRRMKTGFGGPVRAWINGPLAPALQDVMASASFRHSGLFDPFAVEKVRLGTASGAVDGAYILLAIMMIEFWKSAFAASST
jgi:asparagine synthase (glutamine-hydrolysing)